MNRRTLIPSPAHEVLDAVRTVDAAATLHEANEFVFQPLLFLLSPFLTGPGVQPVAPLEIMADPGVSPHRRPPIFSSQSPMGRMTVVSLWGILGTVLAYLVPLPDGRAIFDWTDFMDPVAFALGGLAVLVWLTGLVEVLLARQFSPVPVMSNRVYFFWTVLGASLSFAMAVSSRMTLP